jgi:hypothetical protein
MIERSIPRLLLPAALLGVGLLGINFWMGSILTEKNRLVEEALARLEESQYRVGQIRLLENQPRMASLTEETPDDLQHRIRAALQMAGMSSQTAFNFDPGQLTKETNSSYQRRNTTIRLDQVTLPQLVQFVETLQDNEAGLSVRDLVLSPATRSRSDVESWSVEMTLTQLIFSPKS